MQDSIQNMIKLSRKLREPSSEGTTEGFDFLKNFRSGEPDAQKNNFSGSIERSDLVLFRLDEITFEEESPRQEALENVLASLRHTSGINFVYLILGDAKGVNFYFGLSRELEEENSINLRAWGESILKPSLEGNFRGSNVHLLSDAEQDAIVRQLSASSKKTCYATLEGVPGTNKDVEKKNFQGVDRLVDVMLGDNFGFMVIAHPLSREYDVQTIENDLYAVYDTFNDAVKRSVQCGSNQTDQKGGTQTIGKSATDTEGYSSAHTTNVGKNDGINHSEQTTQGTNTNESKQQTISEGGGDSKSSSNQTGKSNSTATTGGESRGTSSGDSKSNTHNLSYATQTNESVAANTSESKGTSETISVEIIHKRIQEWLKYFDEIIFPRLDYGRGKGIFISSTLLFADNKRVLSKLASAATSLFAGEQGNHIPFKVHFEIGGHHLNALRFFQQPLGNKTLSKKSKEWLQEIVWQHCYVSSDRDSSDVSRFYLGNWMSVKELAVMAGIPQKEVVGLRLKEEVEFGLNVSHESAGSTTETADDSGDKKINLGKLVASGNIKELPVDILQSDFDRHIFVTGVTGAGKTTTCQNLLIDSKLPFLVIEPAKTEYRILLEQFPDMEIFTVGSNVAPLRLNPFHFFKGENISSRVDMIKASIEAAFDMEAAIPQLIEATIYRCYEDKGWNIGSSKNAKYEDPFAPDADAFPTISDVLNTVEKVAAAQGFDARLKNDYIGSIKARLQSLTLGAKGMMLDCGHSIDFDELLDKRVALELEEMRDGGEKSLVIGFVMVNLLEAIKRRFEKNGDQKHAHITLIEEAHRLLSKPQAGDTNKQHGVETFTDMLAEIRKYGESLIIADQIPNKLTPEVLKNTNTKIVHRLFAQDDKDAIGNTMALTEEQRDFLSNLALGRAIVFNGSWPKAVQVQIKKLSDTSNKEGKKPITKDELHRRNLRFYIDRWENGVVDGSRLCGRKPSESQMEILMQVGGNSDYKEALRELRERKDEKRLAPLRELFDMFPNFKEKLAETIAGKYLEDRTYGSHILKAVDCYRENKKLNIYVDKYFERCLK